MADYSSRRYLREVVGAPFIPPARVTQVVLRLREALLGLHRGAAPPPVRVVEGLYGLIDNRVLGLLVELDIPDHLSKPRTAEELAALTGTDDEQLTRLLRYSAARGFVDFDRKGRYRANGVTRVLRRDHPNSWRGWVEFAGSDWFWESWRHAGEALRPSGPAGIEAATGHSFFEYVNKERPGAGEAFNAAMTAGATLQALALSRALDWKGVGSVCDVGGGTGAVLEVLLSIHDHLRGTLFDLPEVVAAAREALVSPPLSSRCAIEGGSFFDTVPPGHDRYLLLAIVHDWDDESAARILSRVREGLPPHGEVVVVEGMLTEKPRDDFVAAGDLLMLVLSPGKERTERQFQSLFERSGLALKRRVPLPSGSSAFVLGKR